MSKNLVIVESPAKAKTIEKFLGKDYSVQASLGHVRDLPKSKLGVDVENGFVPQYLVPREKKDVIKQLKERVKTAGALYLATDPDREGEAIAWHLISAIAPPSLPVHRVVFHEITRDAVRQAFKERGDINMNLVNAQQARRILDRLVGYKISPLLWRKVKRGLSAGRVQSVALRMIVDREREIEAFVPREYWSIEAELAKATAGKREKRHVFKAELVQRNGDKIEVANQQEADTILSDLQGAAYTVADVRVKDLQRGPAPPFTTSTLQQEASRKLNFTAKRTMAVAQQLYEGIAIGAEGTVGLITYMRTDSTQVSQVAIHETRQYVVSHYGEAYVPAEPRYFTRKAKGAQEAHEAIRPTAIAREPEALRQYLSPEQFKLYALVWKRMVASQMAAARLESTTVDVSAVRQGGTPYLFRATGSVVKFPGFLALYSEGQDQEEKEAKPLPELIVGELLDLIKLLPEQHFTQPPPRFTEATLIKALEEQGIGRPSTYAPILSVIQERHYVEKVARKFQPTELGRVVNDLLVDHFATVVDAGFTAQMEEELDEVASGQRAWASVVGAFYGPFEESVQKADQSIERVKVADEPTDEVCEKCGRPMVIKLGRYGRFMACSGFPECRNARPLLVKTGVSCPRCGQGELVQRKTKRGRVFYGCSAYPQCDFTVWGRPIPEPCPKCGGLQIEMPRRGTVCTVCSGEKAEEGAPPARRRRAAAK